MKKVFYSLGLFTVVSVAIVSCKKSPGSIGEGEYYGTYSRDTLVAGLCTTTVTQVNSLTINMNVNGDSLSAFTMTDVEVNGGDQPYSLVYNGIEGTMTGTLTEDEMHWVLLGVDDTITFSGIKED